MTSRAIKGIARAFSPEEGSRAPRLVILAGLLAGGYVALHVWQLLTYRLPAGEFKITHIGGALIIAFVAFAIAAERRGARLAYSGLALLTLLPTAYIFAEHDALTTARTFLPNQTDVWIGMLLLLLTALAVLREWGALMVAILAAALLYGYFGNLMPEGILFHGGISLRRLIGYTSIPYFQGLLGGLAELSAGTIFPFMLLAAALTATGCVDFILQLAFRIGGRTRAGPAQVAVVGSGFMGMVSGSSVANVAATGALTIPLMKRYGFRPEFAGAVEAVASTGGQITPPIMGLAAFLIVGLTGIPYVEIVVAAVAPAFIYYAYLMVAVHLRAQKVGLDVEKSQQILADKFPDVPLLRQLAQHAFFFIAMTYLVVTLIATNLVGRSALESTALLLLLYAAQQLVSARRDLLGWVRAIGSALAFTLYDGARRGAQVAVIVAAIGVLVDILVVTGFPQKLSFAMLEMAGDSLWLLLLIAAGSCLAFGLGMPTSAAYILVALLAAPALVNAGVPLLAAHMFVFFFANVSAITPPVAISCLVAAKIADANFMRTSLIALRLGLPGFILPFLFVIHPEILGLDASLGKVLLSSAMALIGVVALNVMLEGFLLAPLNLIQRMLLFPAAFGLLEPGLGTSLAGLVLFGMVALWQIATRRRAATIRQPGRESG